MATTHGEDFRPVRSYPPTISDSSLTGPSMEIDSKGWGDRGDGAEEIVHGLTITLCYSTEWPAPLTCFRDWQHSPLPRRSALGSPR